MQRNLGRKANCVKHLILLSPVGTSYYSSPNTVTDGGAMRQLPSWLRRRSTEDNWKPLKDEMRRLAYDHGPANMPEKVVVSVDHGHLLAFCEFKEESDAREVFKWIQGHRFEDVVLQAWRYQPSQDGHDLVLVGWPTDPNTGAMLQPPVPNPPAPADPSVSQPPCSRGPFRSRANQTRPLTHYTVVNRTGRNPSVSQDREYIQHLPAASIPEYDSFNNVDAVLAPHISPYAKHLDLYHQRRGDFSPSEGDASELSDSSRTLHNTPELSSSRTSSVSAFPDAYLPARNSNYGTFHFTPGSPYQNHISSISCTPSSYTPAHSRNSSHTFPDTASDEACKVIIRNVKAGVTHEELSELLDRRMPRYVQHEEPKQGEDNKWSVKFSKEEVAEKAREQLNNFEFKERKLQVHLSHGGSKRKNSGGSTTSATSSLRNQRPTIVDGSVPD